MNQKTALSLGAGLLISGLALTLAFRGIPAEDLLRYLKTIDYLWLVPAVLISMLSFVLRVIRWQWLLTSHQPVSVAQAYHPLMIGFMTNCIVPGRAGELVRPFALMKKTGYPFSTGLGSVVTERLFDMLCLLVLFAVLFQFLDMDNAQPVILGGQQLDGRTLEKVVRGFFYLILCLIPAVAILNLETCRKAITLYAGRLPGNLFFLSTSARESIERGVIQPLVRFMESFASGISLLRKPRKTAACFLISLAIWLVQALSYHVMTFACPGLTLSFPQTLTVMLVICFFIALPSVPGYWGVWEAGGIFGLSLFSVAPEKAAGYTLINHVIQIGPVILAGAVSTMMIGVDIRQPRHLSKNKP